MPGLVFFAAMAGVAFLTSLPLLAVEIAQGTVQWPTAKGWLVLLYVGLFPSLLSQIFFMRGVELIGPARAGLFVNLVPVFGALLAVLLLGEPFALYHARAGAGARRHLARGAAAVASFPKRVIARHDGRGMTARQSANTTVLRPLSSTRSSRC